MDTPLIWTSKGNLPAANLTHQVEWLMAPEQVIFIERYLLGDEVVKQSSHVHVLSGAESLGTASI